MQPFGHSATFQQLSHTRPLFPSTPLMMNPNSLYLLGRVDARVCDRQLRTRTVATGMSAGKRERWGSYDSSRRMDTGSSAVVESNAKSGEFELQTECVRHEDTSFA